MSAASPHSSFGAPPPPAPEAPRGSVARLLVAPAVLVISGVALVWLVSVGLSSGARSVGELIDAIEEGPPRASAQAAYELALLAASAHSGNGSWRLSPAETRALAASLERRRADDFTRRWGILALGRLGAASEAVPALSAVLSDPGSTEEHRISAIDSLGHTEAAPAIDVLLGVGAERLRDAPLVEKLKSLQALARVARAVAHRRDDVIAMLRLHAHQEPRAVSWNTSYYLAEYFADGTGRDVLREMASWDHLDRLRGDGGRELTESEKADAVVLGMKGLHALGEDGMAGVLLERLGDPRSPLVRETAAELLRAGPARRPSEGGGASPEVTGGARR